LLDELRAETGPPAGIVVRVELDPGAIVWKLIVAVASERVHRLLVFGLPHGLLALPLAAALLLLLPVVLHHNLADTVLSTLALSLEELLLVAEASHNGQIRLRLLVLLFVDHFLLLGLEDKPV